MAPSEPTHSHPPEAFDRPPAERIPLDQTFDANNLVALRSAVAAHGAALGLPDEQCDDLVLLAHELASNAVLHGGGQGRLRLWAGDSHIYCQVTDNGPGMPREITGDHEQPPLGATGGRGLWLVRILSEKIDLRSGPAGTTVTAALRQHRPAVSAGSRR
jgi:anti-sigma regulatory factor (Ser/Thr protein kinase)